MAPFSGVMLTFDCTWRIQEEEEEEEEEEDDDDDDVVVVGCWRRRLCFFLLFLRSYITYRLTMQNVVRYRDVIMTCKHACERLV